LSSLSALCSRLREQIAPQLLDAPLDAVELPLLDADARELLRGCHEAGEASCLRDLLTGDTLARFLEQTCTEREGQLLCGALSSLLLGHGIGPDDPARLVVLHAPPDTGHELRHWAIQHGVDSELNKPLAQVLPELAHTEATLLQSCLQTVRSDNTRSLLEAQRVAALVRAHLLREARRRAALAKRTELWRSPRAQGALRGLSERLFALLADTTPSTLEDLLFVTTRPVTLDAATGVAEGWIQDRDHAAMHQVTLHLLGHEQRALKARCRSCDTQPCRHAQALAARLLEGCLLVEDSLHAQLSSFVRVPSWQRFFDALSPRADLPASHRERLSYVLRVDNLRETASVGVLLASRAADGTFSSGRLVAPQRALTRPCCSDADKPLLDALIPKSRTLSASFMPVDLAVLRALADHPHVTLDHNKQNVRIREQTLEVMLAEQPDGLLPSVVLGGRALVPGTRPAMQNHVLALEEATCVLTFATLTPALNRLLGVLQHYHGVLPHESYPTLAPYVASLQKVARVELPKVLLGLAQPAPKRILLRLSPSFDEGLEIALSVRPFVLSGLWPPGAGPELVHGLQDGKPAHTRRDLLWEKNAAQEAILALELNETLFIEPFRYRVESTEAALALLSRAAKLSQQLDIEWAEHVSPPQVVTTLHTGDLKVGLFKRGALLFPEGLASHGEVTLAFDKLLDAARRNERFVRISGNHFAEIEADLFQRLQHAQLCVMDAPHVPALPTSAARFFLQAFGDVTKGEDIESTRIVAAAGSLETDHETIAPLYAAALHSYQHAGVRFLLQRARWAPGACLADEMGLGKTVQAIAVLAQRAALGPSLVVCPTSLVDNWRNELSRFAPHLKALVYRGAHRHKLLSQAQTETVLLTSYELLLRDRPRFEGLQFATQVIDEAQVVKNARTLRARAVRTLACEFRIALSGTPVENRLGDLWSLFQLIAPDLLGSWPRFRARFAVPIERYDNADRKEALRNLVAPFLLRRTKDQVMSELPSRTEVVHMVELSEAEQNLYKSALANARRAIGKRKALINKNQDNQRSVYILAELTRLRPTRASS
jgi:hypothetical protein